MTNQNETPGAVHTERSGQTKDHDLPTSIPRGYCLYDITTADFAIIFQGRVVDHVTTYLEGAILIEELETAALV